jgi:site-specific DNA-methyltransferase (adenine-specific)
MIDLRLGDCLDILPTLADMSIDAIITDVPYGTTACKWDVIIPLDKMWAQVKRLCKGAFVTTASQPFTSVLIMSALDMFRYEWVWEKNLGTRYLDANKRPLSFHENIVVFSKNGHTYNPQKWQGAPNHSGKAKDTRTSSLYRKGLKTTVNDTSGMKYPRTVIHVETLASTIKEHPTQKPVALYEYLIKTYTNPGDTVLDFCAGSGTTGVAAIRTGRNAILIEREPEYFAVMERRIHEAQQMELV